MRLSAKSGGTGWRTRLREPATLFSALCAALALTALATRAASPATPITQPAPAALTGTLKIPGALGAPTRLVAVDREWADVLKTSEAAPKDTFLYEGTIDRATGSFRVDKLLRGRTYDLIVWTTDAAGKSTRWEGVTMDYHRAIIPSTTATAEDRKAIEALITDPPQFYDKVRALRMAADHQHATVLVELMRTRDFHSDAGGEVIYRVELWYFENLFGGWAKDKNTEKVIARVRGKPDALPQNWQFLPELGGFAAGDSKEKSPTLSLPETPDAKRGIVGGIK